MYEIYKTIKGKVSKNEKIFNIKYYKDYEPDRKHFRKRFKKWC